MTSSMYKRAVITIMPSGNTLAHSCSPFALTGFRNRHLAKHERLRTSPSFDNDRAHAIRPHLPTSKGGRVLHAKWRGIRNQHLKIFCHSQFPVELPGGVEYQGARTDLVALALHLAHAASL